MVSNVPHPQSQDGKGFPPPVMEMNLEGEYDTKDSAMSDALHQILSFHLRMKKTGTGDSSCKKELNYAIFHLFASVTTILSILKSIKLLLCPAVLFVRPLHDPLFCTWSSR